MDKSQFPPFFYISGLFLGCYSIVMDEPLLPTAAFAVLCFFKCTMSYMNLRVYAFTPSFFFAFVVGVTCWANYDIMEVFLSGAKVGAYSYARPIFFPEATAIWIIGSLMIMAGLDLPASKSIANLSWELPVKYYRLFFMISLLLTIKSAISALTLPGSIGDLLDLTPIFGILFFTRLGIAENNKNFLYYGIILTVVTAIIKILFAYLRSDMLLPVLVFVLGLVLGGATLKKLFHPRFTPIYLLVVIFFVFFEIFGSVRSNVSTGLDRLTQIENINESSVIDNKKLTPFQRLANISQLSAISNLVNKHDFYEGQASEPLVVALVPRVFWPEKPKIALGVWFALEIGEAYKIRTWYNTSINMTIPGHLFLDFGWVGVVIGCFLIGRLLAFFWNSTHFFESSHNFIGSLFGTYILYNCFFGIGADLQIIITLLAYFLLFFVARKLLAK